jgi:hypothetical protein
MKTTDIYRSLTLQYDADCTNQREVYELVKRLGNAEDYGLLLLLALILGGHEL